MFWMELRQLFLSELSNTVVCTTTRINLNRIMAGQIRICLVPVVQEMNRRRMNTHVDYIALLLCPCTFFRWNNFTLFDLTFFVCLFLLEITNASQNPVRLTLIFTMRALFFCVDYTGFIKLWNDQVNCIRESIVTMLFFNLIKLRKKTNRKEGSQMK